ncbi:hypothetical protein V6Z12_A04G113800 [Gossypium hirsutum]
MTITLLNLFTIRNNTGLLDHDSMIRDIFWIRELCRTLML